MAQLNEKVLTAGTNQFYFNSEFVRAPTIHVQ